MQNQGNMAWTDSSKKNALRKGFRRFGGGHPYEDRTNLPMTTVLAVPVNIVIEWEEDDEAPAGG